MSPSSFKHDTMIDNEQDRLAMEASQATRMREAEEALQRSRNTAEESEVAQRLREFAEGNDRSRRSPEQQRPTPVNDELTINQNLAAAMQREEELAAESDERIEIEERIRMQADTSTSDTIQMIDSADIPITVNVAASTDATPIIPTNEVDEGATLPEPSVAVESDGSQLGSAMERNRIQQENNERIIVQARERRAEERRNNDLRRERQRKRELEYAKEQDRIRDEARAAMPIFKEKMLAIAIQALGEENASIDNQRNSPGFGSIGRNDDYLMLRWPYLDLKNKNGETHVIEQFYIALAFDSGRCRFIGQFYGGRGLYSFAEYNTGYMHSHQMSIGMFQGFCTGADGINDLWADFVTNNYDDLKEYDIKFEGFIHQMTSFLSYESLEGVPHKHMRTISAGRARANNIRGNDITRVIRDISGVLTASDIDATFCYDTGKVMLTETDHLHNIMVEHTPSSMMQVRFPNGMYEDIGYSGGVKIDEMKLNDYSFKFKGKRIVPTVKAHIPEDYGKKKEEPKRKYTNGRIASQLIQGLEQRIGTRFKAELLKQYTASNQVQREGKVSPKRKAYYANFVRPVTASKGGVERDVVLADKRKGRLERPVDNRDTSF